jgi:Gpi18-like mannosyltransferase
LSAECSPHNGPVGFVAWLQRHKPDVYKWVTENKWKVSKPDYKAAYEKLTEE